MGRTFRKFEFEQLEDRRLLAADVAAGLMHTDATPPVEQCEVVVATGCDGAAEDLGDVIAETGFDETLPGLDDAIPAETPEIQATADGTVDDTIDANIGQTSSINLDISDGSDGYFGSISPENPSQQFTIPIANDGRIDIVVASSMGNANTNLEVLDGNGELVVASETDQLEGFQVLTFDVIADTEYQLTISSDDGSSGNYQVTAGFATNPLPAIVDLHANEIGDQATELDISSGEAELTGELEFEGDVDVFRFNSHADGEVALFMGDVTEAGDADLDVTVMDADGNVIVDGATNEIVKIAFDVQQGADYFVSVNAAEGQTGAYSLLLELDAVDVQAGEDEVQPEDDHADFIGLEATEILPNDDGIMIMSGELETAEDSDAFRFTASDDGEMMVGLEASSEDHSSDVGVSVFTEEGTLIVAGTTNEDVLIRFDTTAGTQYLALVDSLNDIPSKYELTVTPQFNDAGSDLAIDAEIDETDSLVDSEIDEADSLVGATTDEVADPTDPQQDPDDMLACDREQDTVDEVFSQLDDDILNELDGLSFGGMVRELNSVANRWS